MTSRPSLFVSLRRLLTRNRRRHRRFQSAGRAGGILLLLLLTSRKPFVAEVQRRCRLKKVRVQEVGIFSKISIQKHQELLLWNSYCKCRK